MEALKDFIRDGRYDVSNEWVFENGGHDGAKLFYLAFV
jgi:hypothetical protein